MTRDLKLLAGIFTVSGVLHFVRPRTYESIIPKALPRKRELVLASGALEVACAGLLLHPRTRRVGGVVSAGLLAAVFPANVQMTVDSARDTRRPWWFTLGTVLRLPLQAPMIRIALKAARD
jgi:uncharacterized membrane protein